MSEGFLIGPNLRQELRLLVDERRNAVVKSEVTRLETRFEERIAPAPPNKAIRVCTFTGAWNKSDSKVLTLKFSGPGPTSTLAATNLLFDLEGHQTSARTCIVGKDGTAWYFVSAGYKPPCDSMAGREISQKGYSQVHDTDDVAPGNTGGPAALFLSSGCVEWIQAEKIDYVSNVEIIGGMLWVSKSAAWAFTPIPNEPTTATSAIVLGQTVTQTVVTRISLEPEKLIAERATLVVLGATPLTSTEIEVYECATATGSTASGGGG